MKIKSLIKKVIKFELEFTNDVREARLVPFPDTLEHWRREYANLQEDWKDIETLQELVQFVEEHLEVDTENVLEYIVEEYILED